MPSRIFGDRVRLGAYQTLDVFYDNLDAQYGPGAVRVVLSSAMDEQFVQRSTMALLSLRAQQDIVDILQNNLKKYKKHER
jgi:hypothetical protein